MSTFYLAEPLPIGKGGFALAGQAGLTPHRAGPNECGYIRAVVFFLLRLALRRAFFLVAFLVFLFFLRLPAFFFRPTLFLRLFLPAAFFFFVFRFFVARFFLAMRYITSFHGNGYLPAGW